MKEKEKKTLTKADLATISHYIELEQKRQEIEKRTIELLNYSHKLIKKHETNIEKENDEEIKKLSLINKSVARTT